MTWLLPPCAPAGQLEPLQGKLVPRLRAAGSWMGDLFFVIITERMPGEHPYSGHPALSSLRPAAEQVGWAGTTPPQVPWLEHMG